MSEELDIFPPDHDRNVELRRIAARAKRAAADAEVKAGIKAERQAEIEALTVASQNIPDDPKDLTTTKSSTLHAKVQSYLEVDPDAESPRANKSRLRRVLESIYETAVDTRSPRQVAAASLLLERGYGKPKPSDEALDALARGGIQLVYVAAPEVPVAQERKPLPSKPEFINAEILEDKDDR